VGVAVAQRRQQLQRQRPVLIVVQLDVSIDVVLEHRRVVEHGADTVA
jgi:hypothetical protein